MFNFFKRKKLILPEKTLIDDRLISKIDKMANAIDRLSGSVDTIANCQALEQDKKDERSKRSLWLRFGSNVTKMHHSKAFFINENDIHIYIKQSNFRIIEIPKRLLKHEGILARVIAETIDNIFEDYVELDITEIILRKFLIMFYKEYCTFLLNDRFDGQTIQPIHEDYYYSGILRDSNHIIYKEIEISEIYDDKFLLSYETKHDFFKEEIVYDVKENHKNLQDLLLIIEEIKSYE